MNLNEELAYIENENPRRFPFHRGRKRNEHGSIFSERKGLKEFKKMLRMKTGRNGPQISGKRRNDHAAKISTRI